MTTDPAGLDQLPALPRDDDGPVFRQPWEAQAFAMTLRLHQAGRFTWKEWTECLGAEFAAAESRGEPDWGDAYFLLWLNALEKIVADKGVVDAAALRQRKTEWEDADRETEFGQPVVRRGQGATA